jgi:hypothetical protein
MRLTAVLVAVVLVCCPAAGGEGVTGSWKVTLINKGQQLTIWLIKLETKNGKLTGFAQGLEDAPSAALDKADLKDNRLSFTFDVEGQSFDFEGKLLKAPGGTKVSGSFSLGGRLLPALLEATKAGNGYELGKELVAADPDNPQVFEIVPSLIQQAAKEKATAQEVRTWAQAILRASEKFGERWQREKALQLAQLLSRQEGYLDVAVEAAKAAEQLPGGADYQLQTLDILATVLRKVGRMAEAKAISGRLDQLENGAHGEYLKSALPFKVPAYAGRKGFSKRAVLVELFTGAQCPPCVAADLAFDALEKAYKPSEVVLLQYHLHIPGPDALTNPGGEARQDYYGKLVDSTPTSLFNGVPGAPGGGSKAGAGAKFEEYRKLIDPLLEKPATVKLSVRAMRRGDKIHISALAHGLEKPGAKVNLRLALVEDWVRYRGRNGLAYHSRVVRGLPGGPAGKPLTQKDTEHTVVFDVNELEKTLNAYLDKFAKTQGAFPDAQRPMRFRDWTVVAFVQNDETSEVLQAAEASVGKD